MAKKEKIEAMIDGGKATAAPPLGQALGPMGVNVGQVVAEINKKTEAYRGMKIPVTVIIDPSTKEFEINVGTPPTSALIKKELGIESGAGIPNKDKVGNISVEQLIKIAKMKESSLLVNTLKSGVKCIAGSCNSMGVLVEGKPAHEFNKDVDSGVYDKEISSGSTESTEPSAEKKQLLKQQLEDARKSFSKDLEKIRAEQEAKKAAAAGAAAPEGGAAPGAPGAAAKPAAKK